MAQEAHAKRLLLTHISARYVGKDITNLVNEAKEVFPNTLIVKDFDVVEIPFVTFVFASLKRSCKMLSFQQKVWILSW